MKRMFAYLLVLPMLMLLTSTSVLAAEDLSSATQRQLKRLETFLYGKVATGALMERLARAERDLLGRETGQKPIEKCETLHRFLFQGTESEPSLELKLSFLEWKMFHETRSGKFSERIIALEKSIIGKNPTTPLAFRLEQLTQLTIENGALVLHKVKVPVGTNVRVRLDQDVSSNSSREGDLVPISVVRDLIIEENVLVVAKGTTSFGEVEKARKSGRFGRSGTLVFALREVNSLDGTVLPMTLRNGLNQELDKKKVGMAVGASALGYLALGPVGLVGGVFVKGREQILPKGMELVLSTTEDLWLTGVMIR